LGTQTKSNLKTYIQAPIFERNHQGTKMDYLDKIVIASLPLLVAFVLKIINHLFNLTGDKDKISKEKTDLLKSILELDRPLSQQKYKILLEEVFTLVYKKNIYFDEIKVLLNAKSPKNAIHNYLLARPYIAINKAGLFEYTKPNKLVLYRRCFPFPLFRTLLLTMYVFFTFIGLFLIYIGFKYWSFPIFQNTGKSVNIYIYFLTSEAVTKKQKQLLKMVLLMIENKLWH
jgi:hypothetical protein